jgi:hypothetical protein
MGEMTPGLDSRMKSSVQEMLGGYLRLEFGVLKTA